MSGHWTGLVERIERAASNEQGMRLSPEDTDSLRCLMELTDAAGMAETLDDDDSEVSA